MYMYMCTVTHIVIMFGEFSIVSWGYHLTLRQLDNEREIWMI